MERMLHDALHEVERMLQNTVFYWDYDDRFKYTVNCCMMRFIAAPTAVCHPCSLATAQIKGIS